MPRYRRVRRYNRKKTAEKTVDYKKRAARNRIKRKILGFILLVAVLLIIIRFVPLFNITNISVVGNEYADSNEIIRQSGIKVGDNWFYCRTHKAEKEISKLIYTESVEVKRVLPNKIKIEFTENPPFGYVTDTEGKYLLVNRDGIIMSAEEALPENLSLAEIVAPNVADYNLGDVFDKEDENVITNFRTLLRALEENDMLGSVTMVDVMSGENIMIRYNQLKVIFGSTDKLDYKITNLKTILKQLKDDAGGRLDLSVPGKSYYREKDEEIDYDLYINPESDTDSELTEEEAEE